MSLETGSTKSTVGNSPYPTGLPETPVKKSIRTLAVKDCEQRT